MATVVKDVGYCQISSLDREGAARPESSKRGPYCLVCKLASSVSRFGSASLASSPRGRDSIPRSFTLPQAPSQSLGPAVSTNAITGCINYSTHGLSGCWDEKPRWPHPLLEFPLSKPWPRLKQKSCSPSTRTSSRGCSPSMRPFTSRTSSTSRIYTSFRGIPPSG